MAVEKTITFVEKTELDQDYDSSKVKMIAYYWTEIDGNMVDGSCGSNEERAKAFYEKVCELNGVDKQIALKGMLSVNPDFGATIIWKLKINELFNHFVNVFAANDPMSTFDIYKQLQFKIDKSPVCIFLNTRQDRQYRTNQLLNLIFTKIKPKMLIIRGENISSLSTKSENKNFDIEIKIFPYKVRAKELIYEFENLENYFIIGIGNMVGWGENFIQELKQFKV